MFTHIAFTEFIELLGNTGKHIIGFGLDDLLLWTMFPWINGHCICPDKKEETKHRSCQNKD